MNFVRKILDVFKLESTKEKERIANNLVVHREMSISEEHAEIDSASKLADIANKTTVREEFYNSIHEIESVLTELSKYEHKFNFSYLPSENLRNIRNDMDKQIELLEKRIVEEEKINQKENNLQITYEDIRYCDMEPFGMNKPFISKHEAEKTTMEEAAMEDKINSVYEKEEKQKLKQSIKYILPTVCLLNEKSDSEKYKLEIEKRVSRLKQTLDTFDISADIVNISHGARFTRFEIQIGEGVRIRDILKIENDIKLNLEAANLHIEAPIPGKTTIGIDLENKELITVTFKEMVGSQEFQDFPSNLAFAIGKDLTGNTVVESLENMCHLLICGATGSGKSVCINSIVMSILYKAYPSEVKLILIDTKAVNLSMYNGIPHLIIPVVTNLSKSTSALRWCVAEMICRYKKFADLGVRNLAGYNEGIKKHFFEDESLQKIPSLVVIIDDFSDLITVFPGEIEESICQLAQMGRTCGIHLIISTHRPSADVITGRIKANIPSRIAFNVFSAIDSRTILDEKGAENLLSDGDMLFFPQGKRKSFRVQGTFVSDKEIEHVVNFFKNQMVGYYGMDYENRNIQTQLFDGEGYLDQYFAEAGRFLIEKDRASIGIIQRKFKIGFNRAARIIDQLAEAGVVGEENGTKPRAILMSMEQFKSYLNEIKL